MKTSTDGPGFTATCGNCGVKRDPMIDACPTCGENYEYSAAMADAAPSVANCKNCGRSINFIRSAKTPGRKIPVNPKPLQGVRSNGVVEQFWIAHQATCEGKKR